MQVLASIPNIKIPYPVEGVIRTAQLDDTVAPEDSVQLAVNMNFDRVGAIQTRLGVTEYADSLAEEISNYGTLRNAVRPDGYDSLVKLGETSIFTDATMQDPAIAKVDDEHVIIFWSGVDGDGFAQVMETSLLTGGLTPLGSPLEFDTSSNGNNKCLRIDATHFLNIWTGPSGDGFAQVFLVNAGTFAVTAIGSAFEFDASNADNMGICAVDANHVIVFYDGLSDGTAVILEINLGTFAVTAAGSSMTFSTGLTTNPSPVLVDATHVVCFWNDGVNSDGLAQTFSINTGTWAITAVGSALNFATAGALDNSAVAVGDGEHFINFYLDATSSNGIARPFNVDPGTFAVTAVNAGFVFQTAQGTENSSVSFGDGEHFYNMWQGTDSIMYAQMFEMDPGTFTITGVGSPIPLGEESASDYSASILMSSYRVISTWGNVDVEGVGSMFRAEGDTILGRYLYAGHTDEVSNTPAPGGAWTTRRSGLAQVSKPRFAQYLNYIWMVNGNATIGGDPVATSNGGAFGTDLVPENFPPGDFISAGFEGRVWVVDKYVGAIYYTDIVQFTQPDVYTLTFNIDVNFITTIAPQTGETFTAIYEVPRALLVFTENTITRIYGATSVDAYPAYQVGTYSQESIVETKTGIFFHHSSGFYQFDYGSQPVEISRRVIDFVKAIPRSSYENVKGVYDGFDCIEWSIGQVVVEGVLFVNCVMRYTISTQVWTIYDYPNNVITAMISFDDGVTLNHLMGTQAGLTGAMDSGFTDFGEPFYYEYIDRWRGITDMYYQTKAISGFNVYSENAAGANFLYQIQKSGPNAWAQIGTVTEAACSLFPNSGTDEFNAVRLRLAGNTQGEQVVIHGIEITELEIRGQETN